MLKLNKHCRIAALHLKCKAAFLLKKGESHMKLVIAEKPSVANSLAAVIGAKSRKDGYLEGNGYIVSWCIGHLATLANADYYDPKYIKWRYDDLPILPNEWHMIVNKDKKEQFDILKQLMNDNNITEVINACDAGREGELIFRIVYHLTGCKKPIKRLWISSMEDSAIRNGFANLCSGSDYDSLYKSALCRAKADWLVGINATRLFSVLYNRKLSIGRVMSPTLALVVQRETEISNFKPETFYNVLLEFPEFFATSERIKEQSQAKNLKQSCINSNATVIRVNNKEKTKNAPKLYDLTSLQRDANRILGYTAQQTLDYLQSLYEKKFCTYPRTDSKYLTADMAGGLSELLRITAISMPFADETALQCNIGQVIYDKKVSDHHAIIPTKNINKSVIDELPTYEKQLLELICLRLLCAVSSPYCYDEKIVNIDCNGNLFKAKGKTIVSLGWKALDNKYRALLKNIPDEENDEPILPELTEGQIISVSNAKIKKGVTTPPKRFTEDTLLCAMESAGVKEQERKGLGTPATRAGILEKLVSNGFIKRKKNKNTVQLIPSHDAIALITVLPEQLCSPLLTAEWEYRLSEIEHNKLLPDSFIDGICTMISDLIKNYRVIKGGLFNPLGEVIGKCPRCGGDIAEMQKGFFCQSENCKFAIWKNNKWWALKRKPPTKEIVSMLLNDGQVYVTDLYSEKTGKSYNAIIKLNDDGTNTNFELTFDY